MGVEDGEAKSSLRFSFSRMNTGADVQGALAALDGAARRLGLGD
jgi:cysteine sulfinate desulfinase/cysteine desulfurase-like protein